MMGAIPCSHSPHLFSFPHKASGPRSTIIVAHGGGFESRTGCEGMHVAGFFARAGFNAAILTYRLKPYSRRDAMHDMQRAIRLLRARRDELGITDKIAVMGNSGGGTTSPESPLQGLIKSHNTTQASMASNIGLCAIADAAKEMGYHNAISNASDIYSANSFQPPMTIGTVQASPLTMANVYATMGANGVECTPIAITKVTDRSGSKVKVPSANCHQAIDPDIAQTVSYALNQGVVQPGGEASTTQLDNNRKTFAKTGTNENTVMATAGFVPNQVAAFVAVADAQDPINNTFDNKTINGVYRPSWYGMYIATPAWKQFMNTYLAAINAPIDNDYGKGADKYTVSKGATRTYNQYQYQRQQNSQQQSQQQTNQGQQQQSQQQPAEQQSDQQHQ